MRHFISKKDAREEVVEAASQIVNHEIGLIEGVRILSRLRWHVTDDQFDPDFLFIVGVDSETDTLPIGEERQLWEASVLRDKDEEIKRLEGFYRSKIVAACHVLIKRFS